MTRSDKPRSPSTLLPFAEPERPAKMHTAKVDGASRGNPGPASYAVVMRKPDGSSEFEIGKYVGRATNNVAEYYGLIAALDYAASHGIERLRIQSDSELLVRQMQGRYKVKSADLRPLHERAQKLARGLAFFAIEHIPRELNSEADALANVALDRTSSSGVSSSPAVSRTASDSAAASSSSSARIAAPTPSEARTVRRESSSQLSSELRREKSDPLDGDTRIRARYSNGALHPLEALDLNEGDFVEIRVTKRRSSS
jgi:ribonuclease HI